MTQTTINDCKIIDIRRYSDTRGYLSVVENEIDIPFEIKRIYYLYMVPEVARGAHAHKALQQLLIATSGSVEVIMDDGQNKKSFMLDRPWKGLLIPPGLWRDLENFSRDAVLLCLASEKYDVTDYIRDYKEYIEYKGVKHICYMCGKELSDDGSGATAKRHKEHIIHNGIYGRLKSSTILCEKCGGKYSGSDAKFVELFKGFTDLMSPYLYSKDHGSEERKRIKAYLYPCEGEKTEVEYHAGKTYPKVPYTVVDEEKKEVTLCANKHRLKDFEKVVLKKHPEYADYTIIRKDDVTDGAQIGLFFSEQNPDFNKIFKEGIAKIAAEFALHSGVDRKDIPEILRVEKDGTCVFDPTNAATIPYTPHSVADILVTLAEDMVDANYPCHTLRLFVDEGEDYRMLVCYVDLFSTFRYYIILNKNYDGPEVSNDYAQRIIADKDEEGNALRPEFELGDALEKTCSNLVKIINDFYNTSKLPEYMLDKKTFGELLGTMVADEGLEQVIKEMVDCLKMVHYVKHVVYHYDDVEPIIKSAPGMCLDTAEDDLDRVREYTNIKFMQLNRFCWNVGLFMAEKHSK